MAKILLQASSAEIEVKKSRFLAHLVSVGNVQDIKKFVHESRQNHPRARHVCYAYVLKNGQSGSNDDGEPHGTAGRPLLEILNHSDLIDVCVLVIRYFGGTLLGKGGLARAYKDAAKEALAKAQMQDFIEKESRQYHLSYAQFEKLKKILQTKEIEYHTQFTDEVCVIYQAQRLLCCEIDEKIKML